MILLSTALVLWPVPSPLPAAEGGAPALLRLVDLDGDGLLDRIDLREDGTLAVSLNLGRRRFVEVGERYPAPGLAEVLVTDLDGDGTLDLYLVASGANRALVGDGRGSFVDRTDELGLADAGDGRGAELVDLDGDGWSELVLHNRSGDVFFWSNPGGAFERDAAAASPPAMASAGLVGLVCADNLVDQATGQCGLQASSIPTPGMLFPIGIDWFIEAGTGFVGLGNVDPARALDVSGTVRSRDGGFEFPDGTVQATATLRGPVGPEGPPGPPGPQGPAGAGLDGLQYVALGPGSFVADFSSAPVTSSFVDGVYLAQANSTRLLAGLQVPNGARLKRLSAFVHDTVTGVDLEFRIMLKLPDASGSGGPYAPLLVQGDSGYVSDSVDLDDVVDTTLYPHFVQVRPVGGDWPGDASLAVQAVVVEWEL